MISYNVSKKIIEHENIQINLELLSFGLFCYKLVINFKSIENEKYCNFFDEYFSNFL